MDKGKRDRMQEGIERLREGGYVAPWICREVLNLPADPTWEDVVKSLHSELHRAMMLDRPGDRNTVAAVAILAGAQLLRGMMRR